MIHHCFESQRVYGRKPEQMKATVKMFQLVLEEYPYEKIRAAFIKFLKKSPEMPTPADIAQLIENDGKPIYDKVTYIALQKRKESDDYLTPAEREYMAEYDKRNLAGEKL